MISLLCSLLFAGGFAPVQAQAVSERGRGGLGERAAFERTLEKRIDALLAATLGPDRALAFVRVSLDPAAGPALPQKREPREDAAVLWDEIQRRLENIPPVLPGYPLPVNLKTEVLSRVAGAVTPVRSPDRARAVLTLTLLVDPGVEESVLTPVTAALADALELEPGQGDLLRVRRTPLRRAPEQPARKGPAPSRTPAALYAALAALLLLGAAWFLRRPFAAASADASVPAGASASADDASASADTAVPPETAVPDAPGPAEAAVPARSGTDARSAASPVRPEADAASLAAWSDPRYPEVVAEFLSGESPEAAAALLALLPQETAGSVFRRLPDRVRRDTAALLGENRSASSERFATGELRKRLGDHWISYARGPGLLEELLARAPESIRDGLLADLRRADPRSADRLARRAPSLRGLAAADERSLRLCLSAFSSEELACAFYDFDGPAREKMLESLPLLIREEVRERLRIFVPASMESVDAARANVTARWRRLRADGRVADPLSAPANSV